MRTRRLAVVAAAAALALTGCGGEAGEPSETAPAQAEASTEPEAAPRTVDPDAPEDAVLDASDDMGHKMCELWTTSLEDENDLRDTADDVAWYGSQADNDFMQSAVVTYEWGADSPEHTTVLCRWNGYEAEEGSPSDLLG